MVTCHAFEVQGVHVRAMPVWFVMLVGAPRGSTTVKVQVGCALGCQGNCTELNQLN